MAKRPDLTAVAVVLETARGGTPARPAGGARRAGTVPVTVHVDRQVRMQLKILAVERQITLHQLVCGAFNLVFARTARRRSPGEWDSHDEQRTRARHRQLTPTTTLEAPRSRCGSGGLVSACSAAFGV